MQSIDNNTLSEKVETVESVKTVPETAATQQPETQENINWKRFREQREIERKEKEATERKFKEKEAEAIALKNAMEAILNKQPVQQQSQQYQEDETEDERIQKKVDAALAARDRAFEQQRAENEKASIPQKLSSTYNDFNQVCSQENIDYLEYHYPEVAAAFEGQAESFQKWQGVYKAVKRFVPNTNSGKDAKKAEQNFNKPQSMAVPGATQTGDTAPMMLDEKRKVDNYARMMKVMKGGR